MQSLPAVADSQVITVGYFTLNPHGFDDTGAAVEYFRTLCKENNIQVIFKKTPLPRIIHDSKADVILYLAKTPEREKIFDYSENIWLPIEGAMAFNRKAQINEIVSIDDLKKYKIGAWKAGYRSPMLKNSGLKIEETTGDAVEERILKMIAVNRLDAFYSPEFTTLKYSIEKLGYSDILKVLKLPEPPMPLFLAYSKKIDPKIKKKLEAIFSEKQKKEPYIKYFENYIRAQR